MDFLTGEDSLSIDPMAYTISGNAMRSVIFDTGASLAITFDPADFITPIGKSPHTNLGGIENGLRIEGVRKVSWTLRAVDGSEVELKLNCYYVPASRTCLLSPQRLFSHARGIKGIFTGTEDSFTLQVNDLPAIQVPYDEDSHLPIGEALSTHAPIVNLCVTQVANQNLTKGQEILLEWHAHFEQVNFPFLQQVLRSFLFMTRRFGEASKCAIPKCEICKYAKQKRCPTHGHIIRKNKEHKNALKINDLHPGNTISCDHFESHLKGRTYDSFGHPSSDQFVGGCIFVDHSSG